MHEPTYDYGLWSFVAVNVILFGAFALGFLRPRNRHEWRSLGVFSAFIVALFTEMYGFPLTIYLLTSWLGGRLGFVDPFAHVNGHLLGSLLGLPTWGKLLICQIGALGMLGGLILMGRGWRQIHKAQQPLLMNVENSHRDALNQGRLSQVLREEFAECGVSFSEQATLLRDEPNHRWILRDGQTYLIKEEDAMLGVYRTGLVTDGIYAHMRHPQYTGLFLITVGMLVQWPTLLTLVMFPVLLFAYHRLALREEREVETLFGERYRSYKAHTPAFFPRLTRRYPDPSEAL